MRRLIEHVKETCAAMGSEPITFSIDADGVTGTFRGGRMERTAESVAVILCAVRRARRDQSALVAVTGRAGEAQFLLGHDDDRAALLTCPPTAFDAWRGGFGIALPLACRRVIEAGGRIWTFADARGVVGIALPWEASVS
jgi:hypothetical protein